MVGVRFNYKKTFVSIQLVDSDNHSCIKGELVTAIALVPITLSKCTLLVQTLVTVHFNSNKFELVYPLIHWNEIQVDSSVELSKYILHTE